MKIQISLGMFQVKFEWNKTIKTRKYRTKSEKSNSHIITTWSGAVGCVIVYVVLFWVPEGHVYEGNIEMLSVELHPAQLYHPKGKQRHQYFMFFACLRNSWENLMQELLAKFMFGLKGFSGESKHDESVLVDARSPSTTRNS